MDATDNDLLHNSPPPESPEWCEQLTERLLFHLRTEMLTGTSATATALRREIELVADSDATVLISGETGTGKSLCAHILHYASRRSDFPFIPVSCGAVPDELFENMLFGHERGSYTDAQSKSHGLIKEAEGGTLLLDDVECLNPRTQAKVLRFLDTHKYLPLGATQEVSGNVRIVSTANEDLHRGVHGKTFRSDLYYRLSVLEIVLPPLRDRRDDILPLARSFIKEYCKKYNKPSLDLSPPACSSLVAHDWPGNIRELQNVIHRSVIYTRTDVIENLPTAVTSDASPLDYCALHTMQEMTFKAAKSAVIDAFEKEYLSRVLEECQGNISAAARRAGKNRRAFWELLRKRKLLNLLPSRTKGTSSLS